MLPNNQPGLPNSHLGSVDGSFRSQTQVSVPIDNPIAGTTIGSDSTSRVSQKDIRPSSKSLSSSPQSSLSPFALEPAKKCQHVHGCVEHDQTIVVLPDAEAASGSMSDEDDSQQTRMVESMAELIAQTMMEKMSGIMAEKMMVVMMKTISIMMEKMTDIMTTKIEDGIIQMIAQSTVSRKMMALHGNPTNTTSDVIEAGHTSTAMHNISDGIANDTANQISSLVRAEAAAGSDHVPSCLTHPPPDVPTTTTATTTPPVVTHHDTRQFTITPIILSGIIEPPTQYCYRPKVKVKDRQIIVPHMMLCMLANNPNIMLPLASFQTFFFDRMHALDQESCHLSCWPTSSFDDMTDLMMSIVCGRIRSALHMLYPKAGIYGHKNDDELKAMALELEKGPNEILESIVRDAMVVWNPIRILIIHLEAFTMQYSKCTTPDERETLLEGNLFNSGLACTLTPMAFVYGLYLWDSQWVSDEEWDTLVKLMKILTTEIFPKAYRSHIKRAFSGCDSVIVYFRHILAVVSCCFLHKYRPIGCHISLPYLNMPTSRSNRRFRVPGTVYWKSLSISNTLLKHCTVECMDHLTAYPEFSPLWDLLQIATATDGSTSPRQYIMSEIDLASTSSGEWLSRLRDMFGGYPYNVLWQSTAPLYAKHEKIWSYAEYLVLRMIQFPPRKDPLYKRISSIFPKHVHQSNIVSPFESDENEDPQYQKLPTNRPRPRPKRAHNSSMSQAQSHAAPK